MSDIALRFVLVILHQNVICTQKLSLCLQFEVVLDVILKLLSSLIKRKNSIGKIVLG